MGRRASAATSVPTQHTYGAWQLDDFLVIGAEVLRLWQLSQVGLGL